MWDSNSTYFDKFILLLSRAHNCSLLETLVNCAYLSCVLESTVLRLC